MTDLEIERIHAEIVLMMAQASQASKAAKWYEVTIAIAGTLAIVAIVKLFLV